MSLSTTAMSKMLHFMRFRSQVCTSSVFTNSLSPSSVELTDWQCVSLITLQDESQDNTLESQNWEDMDLDDGENALPMSSHKGGELDELMNMQQDILERWVVICILTFIPYITDAWNVLKS